MEFAIVVPVLFLLVFGIINFGIIFGQTLALNNAARDAARYGVVKTIESTNPRTCLSTLERARAAARSIGMPANDVAVSVLLDGDEVCGVPAGASLPSGATGSTSALPCAGSISGDNDQLRVVATYESGLVVPIVGRQEFTLSGNGYFRCEYSV